MYVRAIFLIFIIFHGFFTSECSRGCYISLSSPDTHGKCQPSAPKCCGTTRNGRRNQCATSCVNFECDSNFDCDDLACCSGKCSGNKNCLPVTTWGVVGIAIVSLFILLALFRTCQWCRKWKFCTRQDTRTPTEDQVHDEPPFVVSDFDNYGFMTPMAPPSYDSVVQNRESRTDGNLPVYNLNLQTIINNSSTIDPGPNNFEVNISIRGSTMFNNDFPPSYSEISNPGDNGDQPPSYSSSQGAENTEEEPPPYSLEAIESPQGNGPTDESPNNTTAGERQEHGDDSVGEPQGRGDDSVGELQERGDDSVGERQERGDDSVGERQEHGNDSVGERQAENITVTADSEQATSTCRESDVQEAVLDRARSTGELLNDERPCCSVSQEDDTVSSELSNSSRGRDIAQH